MKIMNRIFAITLTALLAAGFSATAQRGDRKGQEQPEVWRTMDVPPAPTLTPAQALESFKLAPGFRIEIAAADPLVHDPVAMAFDADGRMWVVEMRAYMPNVDGKGEDARTGRVGVLEDTNGDGRMDKRTDFLTGLQMPRAISLVKAACSWLNRQYFGFVKTPMAISRPIKKPPCSKTTGVKGQWSTPKTV
jgi:glucose/arabinose dehydrogenase